MSSALYDPSVYDGCPSLYDAGYKFDLKNGQDLVQSKFADLFIQHNVERIFGLSLLHRHFDLAANERLVEYRGTSVPWEETLEKASPYIRPDNWALAKDGSFRPFEFHYSMQDFDEDEHVPSDPRYLSFVQALKSLLHEEGVTDLFGLCKYPGDGYKGRVEVTEGRANINLDPSDYPNNANTREAAWYFSTELKGKCVCTCAFTNSGHSGRHGGHVASR